MGLRHIDVRSVAPGRLERFVGAQRSAAFVEAAEAARIALEGRAIVNVNSTASGGGVAELLQTLVAYARGAGVDARWVVIEGNPRFFEITKRLHNHLYGMAGDGGPLGASERRDYEDVAARNVDELVSVVRPGDIVVLHDPQSAALVPVLRARGVAVVWRCHVGIDVPNEYSDAGWEFLRPYLDDVDGYVFSCAHFVPAWVPTDRVAVIAPSIDPFSAKNEPIEPPDVIAILQHVGVLADGAHGLDAPFTRRDGTRGRVDRRVDTIGTGLVPGAGVPIVLQASRWDRLKDMPGVLTGFAEGVVPVCDAHLVLAGPEVDGVADDPEAGRVLEECRARWQSLGSAARERIHLVNVPMADPDEAATIVNALQRHAAVVVQKSIAEGFGLTVTEAMWKARPVVATAVGGIVDQVVPGQTGWLLDDPYDLGRLADTLGALLADPADADRMGARGLERVRTHFLADRHLTQWARLFAELAGS